MTASPADVLPVRADYNGDVVSSGLLDGGERVGEQGAAGNFVQHLRSIRTHPSAFAGRENHGQATADRTHVKVLPFGARPPRAGIAAAPEPHHRALRPKRPDGALADRRLLYRRGDSCGPNLFVELTPEVSCRSYPSTARGSTSSRASSPNSPARCCAISASHPNRNSRTALWPPWIDFNRDPVVHTWSYKLDQAA